MQKLLTGMVAILIASGACAKHPSAQERGTADLAKALKGYVAQGAQRCLSSSDVTGSYIIDGTAIVYHGLGGRIWVNRTTGPDHLREDDIPVQEIFGAQMCRLDRVKLLDRSTRMEHFTVFLSDFTSYRKGEAR
jgi:hypothetical protein